MDRKRTQSMLVTKTPLFSKNGNYIGIASSRMHTPLNQQKTRVANEHLDKKGRFYLPSSMGSEYLTKKEVDILKKILLGKTSKQIAKELLCSYRTVEEYTSKIKRKFQCTHKTEISSVAIKHGITYILL